MHANDLCWPLFSHSAGALKPTLAVRCGLSQAASRYIFIHSSVQRTVFPLMFHLLADRRCRHGPLVKHAQRSCEISRPHLVRARPLSEGRSGKIEVATKVSCHCMETKNSRAVLNEASEASKAR